MVPEDVLVFPLNTPNVTLTDAKQYLAAQKSVKVLTACIEELGSERSGYRNLLQKRLTETAAIINKLEVKYGIE